MYPISVEIFYLAHLIINIRGAIHCQKGNESRKVRRSINFNAKAVETLATASGQQVLLHHRPQAGEREPLALVALSASNSLVGLDRPAGQKALAPVGKPRLIEA